MGVMTPEVAEALDRLRRATASRRRAEAALERARAETKAAIVAADDLRVKQVEIVDISGYNREHIRRIVLAERAPETRRRLPASDT